MKNILVPTDFSDNCNRAAKLAIQIAELFSSEIHFLHQLKTPVDWVKLDKLEEKNYPKTQKQIGSARAKLREIEKDAEHKGLKCRKFLEFVSDENAIVAHSQNFHHDFIITGSKGTEEGFLRKLLGSNAQKIIREARVPILVVKEKELIFPFKEIVFVSDFKKDASQAFSEVQEIAKKCNAKIHLLNINTESDFNSINNGLQPVEDFLKQFPEMKNYAIHIYNEANVSDGITKFSDTYPVDLIAMYTNNRKGLENIFSKSIAESVTNHSKTSVMTVHI